MSERQQSKRGWFGKWREHQRVRRQQAFERQLLEHKRAGTSGDDSTVSGYEHTAPAAGWIGFGGDGGG